MTPRVLLPAVVRQASPALVATSLFCWMLLYFAGDVLRLAPFCSSSQTLVSAGAAFSTLYGVVTTVAVATLLWIVMAIAMTAPLLAQPIAQLRLRCLTRRRNYSVGLFAAAYLLIWIAAAPILLATQKAIEMLAGVTALPAIAIALAVAAAWQAAPTRQNALNRCHRVPNLAAFGAAADFDCIRFGLVHGFWCAATCAPTMLLPLTTPALQLPLMFVISVALQLERLAPARAPSWTLRILPGQPVAAVLFRSIRWSLRRPSPFPSTTRSICSISRGRA
jgi:predicted metal-binding membrane protein